MKKTFLLLAGITLFFLKNPVKAQEPSFCGTVEMNEKAVKEHPELLKKHQELEEYTKKYVSSHTAKERGTIYRIPLVFHVLHDYGAENISDEQIYDAVRILNEDFRKLNADTTAIVSAFKSIAADCEIEFRLAQKDPNGNCTNGIERIATQETYVGNDDSKLNDWAPTKYLNVWLVSNIEMGAAGYSYYPGFAPDPSKAGVMIIHSYVGSIGTGTVSRSRALTHEIGHYLNLAHCWGNSNTPGDPNNCSDDDGVSDTPVDIGWTTCNLSGASCGSALDNVQNYMEYSYCSNMYTEGQKERMRAALTSSIEGRNNLWTTNNLQQTGTDGTPATLCAPKADFMSSTNLVCSGSTIKFTDLSWNGKPSTWTWSFPGGTPSSSNDSMPEIQYNTAGNYAVTLTSGNSTGSNTRTKNNFVKVISSVAKYNEWQFYDEFEAGGNLPNADWSVNNIGGGVTWQKSTDASTSGTTSVKLSNIANTAGSIDELISPTINVAVISNPSLRFKVAYAQKTTATTDKLQVYVSKDCGQSWTLRYAKSGLPLSTAGIQSSAFIPNSSQWREETVNIATVSTQPNVMFKFVFTSDGGNNIFLDDINVSGPVGIFDQTAYNLNLSVYPNPAEDNSVISFNLTEKATIRLSICDILGRNVMNITEGELKAGEHQYAVDASQKLKSGIYFIRMNLNNREFTQKLIVK